MQVTFRCRQNRSILARIYLYPHIFYACLIRLLNIATLHFKKAQSKISWLRYFSLYWSFPITCWQLFHPSLGTESLGTGAICTASPAATVLKGNQIIGDNMNCCLIPRFRLKAILLFLCFEVHSQWAILSGAHVQTKSARKKLRGLPKASDLQQQ